MKRLARLALFIMLAVALPFHSAYGVGMAQSMALATAAHGYETTAVPVRTVAGHAKHDGHDRDGAGQRHHPADAAQSHEHGGLQVGESDGGVHCGTCTACSTSVGLTGTAQWIPWHEGYEAMASVHGHRLRSIPSSRLDRPPLVA